MNLELKLVNLIESDYFLCSILSKVEELQLNDCWVAAGIIRNKIWDNLHKIQTEINDIDVIYFDDSDISLHKEKTLESKLKILMPNQPWSVKNQARMHVKNGVGPYSSSYDGVAHFPETPTSIAIRMKDKKLEIIAPYGLQDLFEGLVRPTPPYQKGSKLHPIYLDRIQNKKWNTIWGNLVIELG